MAPRSLGYRTDLMLRRLAGATVDERDGVVVVRTVANPNFYWGNFLLFSSPPVPGDAAAWVARFGDEFPDAEHVSIGVDGIDGDLGAADEMRALGLVDETSVVLTATSLHAIGTPPTGVELRPPATDEEWAQTVDFRIAVDADGGPGHREFVTRRAAEFRALAEDGHGVYVAAFVDGIARSALGLFAADGLARYQNVETHPDFRRRGLASGLVVEAARLMAARERIDELVIVADPSYVAIEIYRRLGFQDSERQVQWLRKPPL